MRLGWLGVANVAPLTARLFASKKIAAPVGVGVFAISRSFPAHFRLISRSFPAHFPLISRSFPAHFPAFPAHFPLISRSCPVDFPFISRSFPAHFPLISRSFPIFPADSRPISQSFSFVSVSSIQQTSSRLV